MRKRTLLNIGDKLNKWTILGEVPKDECTNKNKFFYKAICECGSIKIKVPWAFKKFGCLKCMYEERKKNRYFPGYKIGKWTIIQEIYIKTKSRIQRGYLCHCDCGYEKKIVVQELSNNLSKQCNSCRKNEQKKKLIKHDMSRTLIYKRWVGIKRRCLDKNNVLYGARGIRICDRWLIFENFYQDMGNIPFKGAQLDRIDPDGHYEPRNCRWVTPHENLQNRRCSKANSDKYIYIRRDKLPSDFLDKLENNKKTGW